MQARNLGEDAFDYVPQFTSFILCNDKFKLETPNEECMTRRLKFCPFTQTFDDTKAKQGIKNVQKRNDKLVDKEYLKILSIQLMKILLHNYKSAANKYLGKTIEEPAMCKRKRAKFFKLNDPVTDFYKDKINKVDGKNNFILFTDLMREYTQYCRDYNYKPQTKKELLENLKSIHGKENYKENKYYSKKVDGQTLKFHHRNVFLNMVIKNEEDEILNIDEKKFTKLN